MKTKQNAHYPLQKLNFRNIDKNLHKSRYRSFLVLHSFAWFFDFITNIWSRIIYFEILVVKAWFAMRIRKNDLDFQQAIYVVKSVREFCI